MASTANSWKDWPAIRPALFDVSGQDHSIIILYGLVLEGRLDADVLTQAWKKLCMKWPILSARMRENVPIVGDEQAPRRGLESRAYYVPPPELVAGVVDADASADRSEALRSPLVVDNPRPIRDTWDFVQGSDLPQDRPTAHLGIQPRDTKPKTRSKPMQLFASNAPLIFSHLLTEDRPVVTAKITRFDDVTTLGLAVPHVLCDGPGAAEIIRAWAAIVNGQADSVQPLAHIGQDIFAPIAPASLSLRDVPVFPGASIFSTFDLIRFGLGYTYDLLWKRPDKKLEGREIFFPNAYLAKLKQQVLDELRSGSSAAGDETDVDWVSTSDIVTALAIKHMCAADARGPEDSRALSLAFPVNLRTKPDKIADLVLPTPYLHNANAPVFLSRPIGSFAHAWSVTQLAVKIRHAIRAHTETAVMRDSIRWRTASRGRVTTFFRPSDFWLVGSNWRIMKLYEANFYGAALTGEQQERERPQVADVKQASPGSVRKIWTHGIMDIPWRNNFVITGDDPAGGIWVTMVLSKKQWQKSQQISTLAM